MWFALNEIALDCEFWVFHLKPRNEMQTHRCRERRLFISIKPQASREEYKNQLSTVPNRMEIALGARWMISLSSKRLFQKLGWKWIMLVAGWSFFDVFIYCKPTLRFTCKLTTRVGLLMLPVEADDAYWVLVALNIVVLRVHDMCSSPWFMIYLFF